MKKNVAVLMGGYSSEYNISLKSGEVVYNTLLKEDDINLFKVIISENEWKCDQCKNYVRPRKRTIFWKTSDILIILLKRYTVHQKIDTYLSYPERLDLKDISFNYGKKNAKKYALQGFCVHGGSLGGGHYFAVCKNHLDKRWYEYNDTNVSPLETKQVFDYTPYLLFYKRI